MLLILVIAGVVVTPVALYAAALRNMAACYAPAGPVPGPEAGRPARRRPGRVRAGTRAGARGTDPLLAG